MPNAKRMEVRPITDHARAARVPVERFFIRPALCALAVFVAMVSAPSAGADTYLSHFYNPTDVIVFMPEAGTAVILRNASGVGVAEVFDAECR